MWYAVLFAETQKDFPEGKGKNLVVTTCTPCHSGRLVLQQKLSRTLWDSMITRMQKRNGLWELSSNDRKEILDYLETHFSASAADKMDGLGPRAVNPIP